MPPLHSRPAGAVTHHRQRVVHGLLLRMSLEPQIAAVGGFGSRAAHQILISAYGWDQYLSRRSPKGEAGHSLRSQHLVGNCARASKVTASCDGVARRAKPQAASEAGSRAPQDPAADCWCKKYAKWCRAPLTFSGMKSDSGLEYPLDPTTERTKNENFSQGVFCGTNAHDSHGVFRD